MDKIEKALQDLSEAVKCNPTVDKVKITITLKKPKSNKASNDNK